MSGWTAFSARVTSKPFIAGSRMSTMARSGLNVLRLLDGRLARRHGDDVMAAAEDPRHGAEDAGVVVDDQDAGALRLGGHRQPSSLRNREDGPDARSRTRAALDLELPAKLRHDRPADRQAQPVAVGLGREERLLDPGQVLPRDPAAGVLDDQLQRAVARRSPGSTPGPSGPVASRALLIRLSKSCSTSAWTAKRGGRSAGTSITRRTPRRSSPSRKMASAPSTAWCSETSLGLRTVPRAKWTIAPKIRRQTWIECSIWRRSAAATAGSSSFSSISSRKLLDQGKHRAQGVVHVVGNASRQVGHGMLPLRDQHALLERFGPIARSEGPRPPGAGTARSARPRSGRTSAG